MTEERGVEALLEKGGILMGVGESTRGDIRTDRRDDSRGRSSHRRDDNEDRSSSMSGFRGGSRDDEDRKPVHNEGEVQEAPMPGVWQVVEDSGSAFLGS